jgi:hypothetical protein
MHTSPKTPSRSQSKPGRNGHGPSERVRDDRADAPLDDNFQGYGQTVTDETGGYRFRTIRPVPYPGRTPHIHFAVSGAGLPPFVTRMYVAGPHPRANPTPSPALRHRPRPGSALSGPRRAARPSSADQSTGRYGQGSVVSPLKE